jgi:hypothetical protein
MAETEEEKNEVEKLVENLKDYVETRYQLALLNMQDRLSDVVSSLVVGIAVALLSTLVLLFVSVAVAIWLGTFMGSLFSGFLCVAGFYLLLAILILMNQEKWIKIPLINLLIKKMNANAKD